MRSVLVQAVLLILGILAGASGMYHIQESRRAAELDALKESLMRLTKQERRAEFQVLGQVVGEVGVVRTEVRFTELDANGHGIGKPRTFETQGEKAHIDPLIVKFDDDFALSGDPARGNPLLLFRRAYGDRQAPAEGVRLDELDEVPQGYATEKALPEWERKLWEDF